MASSTEISNLAISHLGIGKEIANLDTEKSAEAAACRRFYEISKESTLADVHWTFATKFATLNLIEENPTDEWRYSYRYPVDCIHLRRIVSNYRNETVSVRIPFKILKDNAGRIIYTDQENAEAEYTEDVNDAYFTPTFILAFSFRLASYIAPRLTGGDPFKIKAEMLAQYQIEIDRARKININEEVEDPRPESELISVRS